MCVLYAGQSASDIEMIASTALTDSQLSAALGQQVASPNRVFSTHNCYAAVSVGFPDCVNVTRYLVHIFLALHIYYEFYIQNICH